MTLQQVSEAVSVLQSYAEQPDMEPTDLNQKNKDLFFSLFQEDSFFIVSEMELSEEQIQSRNFIPYAAPALSGTNLVYLRLFSHKDAAEYFLKEHEMVGQVIPIPAVESIQLAKFWLTHGVYGFMLNDGQVWATISFTDYLYSIFHELLNREDMYNSIYVELANFMVFFLAKEPFFLAEKEAEESLSSEGVTVFLIGSEEKQEGCIYTHLTNDLLETLIQKNNELVIEASCTHIRTTMSLLKRVVDEFETARSSEGWSYIDLKFVNLDFCPNEESGIGFCAEPESDQEESFDDLSQQQKKEKEFNKIQIALKEKISIFNQAVKQKVFKNKQKEKEFDDILETANEENEQKEKTQKRFFSKKKIVVFAILATILVGLFSFIGMFFSGRGNFEKYLQNGNYKDAYLEYQDNNSFGFYQWANELISEEILETITDYANGVIYAEEAGERLQGLKVFSQTHQEELSQAFSQAKKLEASKNAYVSGNSYLEKQNYLQALSDWTLVIKEDVNYADMVQRIKTNEEIFKLQGLLQCKNYLLSGDTNRYQAGIDILHQWFPYDQTIGSEWDSLNNSSFETEEPNDNMSLFDPMKEPDQSNQIGESSDTVKNLPIVIQKLKVGLPANDTGRNLYIGWSNQSNQTIQSIVFTVQAANEVGDIQTCTRNGYSEFEAEAVGPFAPGEGLDGKQGWEKAWYGTQIQKAILKGVFIQYSDGNAINITDTASLQILQSNASEW